MESLIDLCIEDEEDEVTAQHFRIFDQADAQRNQIVKVSYTELAIDYDG